MCLPLDPKFWGSNAAKAGSKAEGLMSEDFTACKTFL
jgi:hypothetical protein